MIKTLTNKFYVPIKGVKKKTLCQFSDVHLTAWDELSSEKEKEEAIAQTKYWEDFRLNFANGHGESSEPFQRADTLTHYNNFIDLASTVDAAVMAGDILDYVSGANIRAMERGLSRLTVPFVITRGNHETGNGIPDGLKASVIKKPLQTVDLGDLQIVGIDNSQRFISTAQLSELEQTLKTGKPTVIAMHIPIKTEGNKEKLTKAGEYFQLNYPDCPKENSKFISMITDKKYNVAAVLTGHLHFGNVSEIENGIYQFGSSQGLLGNVNLITFGE